MSAEIIKLPISIKPGIEPSAASATVHHIPTKPELSRNGRPLPPALTESCRNHRARLKRRDVWWQAERTTSYWRARREWSSVLRTAQQRGIGDADHFPQVVPGEEWDLVERWRTALVKQMLTPAPDLAAVAWKRARLTSEHWEYCDVKPERLQQAIDADAEWLAAHPSKKSIDATKQAAKARFKEAMRQRIRTIAASRGLSDDDIKPAMTLKHEAIGAFCRTYKVRVEWLLEGSGPTSMTQEELVLHDLADK